MGKTKEALYDLATIVAKLSDENMKPEYIDMELRDMLPPYMYELYQDNIDFIDEMVYDMKDDGTIGEDGEDGEDEPWTDPAGGTHYPGEDPAAMYESLFMPFIQDFE